MESILKDERLLFYDIEVFKYDALIVFKDITGKTVRVFHNNFNGLQRLIQGKTLVGYNNYFYDDFILSEMLMGRSLYQIKQRNDYIINGNKGNSRDINNDILSLDCFQQIDISMPSLKKVEANRGLNIYESEIPFDLDRPLTEEELQETIDYCSYDVAQTLEIFKLRKDSYFIPKLTLISRLKPSQQAKALRWNTTTISANLLLDRPLLKWSDLRLGEYDVEGEYELFKKIPATLYDFWQSTRKDGKGKLVHYEHGLAYEFGWGGLHGVNNDDQKVFKNVKLLDVASLYPNIIIKLQALGPATDKFKEIVKTRLTAKHQGDKVLSDALKLMINSVYGLLKNKYSLLFNPYASKSVCIYGQIILYDLCARLAPYSKLVQVNTDGVAFTTENEEYKRIWQEWQDEYGFELELEEYETFIQKDVNNYIAVDTQGKVKVKGGDVAKYHAGPVFRTNSLAIVDKAVVDQLLYGKDVIETLTEKLDQPILYQVILQAGSTYEGTFDDEGNKYQKVNRVYPVHHGTQLFKQREDGSRTMYPDSPENMKVYNGSLDTVDIDRFKEEIDLDYYYQLVDKVLKRWRE